MTGGVSRCPALANNVFSPLLGVLEDPAEDPAEDPTDPDSAAPSPHARAGHTDECSKYRRMKTIRDPSRQQVGKLTGSRSFIKVVMMASVALAFAFLVFAALGDASKSPPSYSTIK